jgi:hypothetical protein
MFKGKRSVQKPTLAAKRQFRPSPIYPPPISKQSTGRPVQGIIFGIMFVLLLIIGGSFAYLYVSQKGSSTAKITQTIAPSPTATPTANPDLHLPAPAIPVGQLLFGTPLPGNPCDPALGSWSNAANIHITCTSSATELSNTKSRSLAGTLLNILPGSQGIPNNYILQVQVRPGSHSRGAYGVLFRNQPGSRNLGAYSFMLTPKGMWSSNVYDNHTGKATQFYTHSTTLQLRGLITIDLRVQGDTYLLYVNGRQQGNAISDYYPTGTVGLAVDPGADVFFSNFALYALPGKLGG